MRPQRPPVAPRVVACAARPLAEALSAARIDFPLMSPRYSHGQARRELVEGWLPHKNLARASAVAAMVRATKSKSAVAAHAAAGAETGGEVDALDADAPLVPQGWVLPSGMRHVSHTILLGCVLEERHPCRADAAVLHVSK